MNKRMKELLNHLGRGNYSTEDVVTIMDGLKDYGKARVEFNQAGTPESEALARWHLEDARNQWTYIMRTYDLPMAPASAYY